jgi:hypothetical protein
VIRRLFDLGYHVHVHHALYENLVQGLRRERPENRIWTCVFRDCGCAYTRRYDMQRHMADKH